MTDNRDTRGPWYPFDLRIFFRRVAAKLNSEWMRTTYPFASVGRRVSIDPSCDISRRVSRHFAIGNHVFMARGVWINIVETEGLGSPKLIIGDQCRIGRRSTISVRNRVQLEDDVLLAPNVLIMDHNHEYSDPNLPIHAQGVTEGGQIVIGRNTWLGYGCIVSCGKGELILGRNCVVGANSVVLNSFPAFSVIAGNPAKLIKTYDHTSERWIRAGKE